MSMMAVAALYREAREGLSDAVMLQERPEGSEGAAMCVHPARSFKQEEQKCKGPEAGCLAFVQYSEETRTSEEERVC